MQGAESDFSDLTMENEDIEMGSEGSNGANNVTDTTDQGQSSHQIFSYL